jgi:hypothetical protein
MPAHQTRHEKTRKSFQPKAKTSVPGQVPYVGTQRRSKSLLVLFFRKEQDSSFSEEKEAKRLYSFEVFPRAWPMGRSFA